MRTRLREIFRRLMPHKTYQVAFVVTMFMLIIVFIPFSIIISSIFSSYAKKTISENTMSILEKQSENTKELLQTITRYGYKIYDDRNINDWLYQKNENDLRNTFHTWQALRSYVSLEPSIERVFLINMATKTVIDSSSRVYDFNEFYDQEILVDLRNKERVETGFFNSKINGEFKLAIITPSRTISSNFFGYTVLIIDAETIKKRFIEDERTRIVILNQNNEVLLGENNPLILEAVYKYVPVKNGTVQVKLNGESVSLNYSRIDAFDWTVCQISIQEMQTEVLSIQLWIIAVLILFLIILMIVTFISSRRTYLPFSNLAQKISLIVKEDLKTTNKSEFETLNEGVEKLIADIHKLDKFVWEHHDVIRTENLRQWILTGHINPYMQKYLEEESGILKKAQIYFTVVRIESYPLIEDEPIFKTQKLYKFAVQNITEEILRKKGYDSIATDLGVNHIIGILGSDNQMIQNLIDTLDETREVIRQLLNCQVVIGLSNECNIEDSLREIYEDTLELTNLKFVLGLNKVYVQKEYEAYQILHEESYDEDSMTELIQTIRLGRTEQANKLLKKIFIQMKNMPYNECRFQITRLIYTISKTFHTLAIVNSFGDIGSFIGQFNSLTEIEKWLNELIIEISAKNNNRHNEGRREETFLQITEYINSHLSDPMLSTDEIAEQVSFSTGYLRKWFKEYSGGSISDYILKQRLESVKNLLEQTDWAVMEIAERTGFQTKSHFFTVFKKHTGATPNDYRISKRTDI